jgi:serine/threonine-protein kinase RsbW/stage II sporulation protein AB (anti-sigma F factor)
LLAGAGGDVLGVASACWSIPALADEVSGVRWAAVEFAREHGVPDERLGDLRLAISEAVSNAVIHAFRTREWPGTVTVTVLVEPGRFAEVVVRDDGDGMSKRDDSPGVGLGLPLISRIADETRLGKPSDGGLELWMRFRLGAA